MPTLNSVDNLAIEKPKSIKNRMVTSKKPTIPLNYEKKRRKTDARTQVSFDAASTLAQKLGIEVRKARERANLNITQAASLCGVGTRFLLDLELGKPSIQLDLATDVAKRFGIDVEIKTRTRDLAIAEKICSSPRWATLQPPKDCQNPEHWVILQHVGNFVANGCGLPALKTQVVRSSGRLSAIQMDLSPLMTDDGEPRKAFGLVQRSSNEFKTTYFQSFPSTIREEGGGHGLAYIFDGVLRESSSPIQDIEKVLRWAALSISLLGFDIHAGQVVFFEENGGIRLAPFTRISAYSGLLAERDFKGFRIGGSWNESHLRAANWEGLAKQAGVHPKFLYHILKECNARIPRLVEDAVHDAMGAYPRFGSVVKMISDVRKSCQRLDDIVLLASRSVSGMNVKRAQPPIDVLDPILILKPTMSVLAVDD